MTQITRIKFNKFVLFVSFVANFLKNSLRFYSFCAKPF
jgi:hypothetical protein